MGKYCVKCGNEINEGMSFCTKCGAHVQKTVINNNASNNVNMTMINNVPPVNNNQKTIEKKPKKKKHGCLIAFLIFVVIIAGLVGLVLFLTRTKDYNEEIKIHKDYQYLAISKDDEYIISNAEPDIFFHVTNDAVYEVLDEDSKKVNTKVENNKVINPSNYEEGKEYTIKLKKGSFLSSQLENTKKVVFKIKRKEVRKHTYSDKVEHVAVGDIVLSSNNKSFVSNKKYEVGDVVVVGNNDSLSAAYYVMSATGNTYQIRPAELNEIFSELDYYYEAPADLSNLTVSKEIEEYVVNNVKSSAWFSYIVDEVHAAPSIEIDINKTDTGGIEAEVKVKLAAGQSSFLMKSVNHEIEIIFKQTLSVSTVVDITLTNWDVSLDVTSGQDFEFNIENKFLDYSDVESEEATEELMNKLKEAIAKKQHTDTSESDAELAEILIPTGVPCLSVVVELELVNEISASVDFGVGFGQTTNVVVGFDYGVGEEFRFIGSYDKKYNDVTLSFAGKIEEKFGIEISIGIDVLSVVSAKADLAAGLYAEAEMEISSVVGKKHAFETSLKVENGIFIEFGVSAELLKMEVKHTFVEKKWPIISKEWSFSKDFNENPEDIIDDAGIDSIVSGDSNGFEFTGEKERLEQYSCVDSMEDDSYIKYKFNYDNGEFENIEMVGVYLIDYGNDSVNSLMRLILKAFTIYFKIYYNFSATYYESGAYSYIVITLDENDVVNEFGDVDVSDYYSFKAQMKDENYICK